MAHPFNAAQNVSSFAQSQGASGRNEQWKSDAFINIYVPTAGGSRRKLGYIALKNSRPSEKALIDRLAANPDDIEALKAVISLDFQLAEGDENAAFAF